MKTNKLFKVFFVVFTVFVLSMILVACNVSSNLNEDTDEETTTHTLVAVEAVEATCDTAGNTAYWYCSDCGKYFSDGSGENEISIENTVVSALGHDIAFVDANEPTSCDSDGNTAYYVCTVCGKYFEDEECLIEIAYEDIVIPSSKHSVIFIEAVKPTSCDSDGNIEYWYCSVCGKYFSDENGENEIAYEDIVISSFGHTYDEDDWTAAVDAACTESGMLGYYVCVECGAYLDEDGIFVSFDLTDLVLTATGHTYSELIEGYEATCEQTGYSDYYKCLNCYECFVLAGDDYVLTGQEDLVIPATGHTLGELVEAVDATCTTEGNIAYCVCTECGKYFNESSEEIDSGNITTAALGHDYVDGICTRCSQTVGSLVITTADGNYTYASSEGYEEYTISSAGSYYLTGECESGQIYVNAGDDDKVYLYLNGVDITHAQDSVIYVANADKVYIVAVSSTTNTISDTRDVNGTYENTGSAAIYSACD